MTKRNGFYQCDRDFLRRRARDATLSPGEFRLLDAIMSLLRLPGEQTTTGNGKLAELTTLDPKTVSRLRARLVKKGYLKHEGFDKYRVMMFRLNDAPLAPSTDQSPKGSDDGQGDRSVDMKGSIGGYDTHRSVGTSRGLHIIKETKETMETRPPFSSPPDNGGWRAAPPEMLALLRKLPPNPPKPYTGLDFPLASERN